MDSPIESAYWSPGKNYTGLHPPTTVDNVRETTASPNLEESQDTNLTTIEDLDDVRPATDTCILNQGESSNPISVEDLDDAQELGVLQEL